MFGKIAATEEYVLVEHPPVSELSDTLDRLRAVAGLFRNGQPRRLLVDLRYIHPVWAPEEAAIIADTAQREFPKDLKSAILVGHGPRDERVHGVIRRRREWGANVRAFNSPLAARAWLLDKAGEDAAGPDRAA